MVAARRRGRLQRPLDLSDVDIREVYLIETGYTGSTGSEAVIDGPGRAVDGLRMVRAGSDRVRGVAGVAEIASPIPHVYLYVSGHYLFSLKTAAALRACLSTLTVIVARSAISSSAPPVIVRPARSHCLSRCTPEHRAILSFGAGYQELLRAYRPFRFPPRLRPLSLRSPSNYLPRPFDTSLRTVLRLERSGIDEASFESLRICTKHCKCYRERSSRY